MPRTPSPFKLPANIRQWLDSKLVETNFSNYRSLSEELQAQGFDVSKSALHRYGKKLRATLAESSGSLADAALTANALCILAAAISHPENVSNTAKAYMNLVRNEGENGG